MSDELIVPRDARVAIFGEGGFAGGGDGTRMEINLREVGDDAYEKISGLIDQFLEIDPKQFPRGMDVFSYGLRINDDQYSLYPCMLNSNMPNFPRCIRELYDTIDAERTRLGLPQQRNLRPASPPPGIGLEIK